MAFDVYKKMKTAKLCLALGMIACVVFLGGCARRASAPPGTTSTPQVEQEMGESTGESGGKASDSNI